MEYDNEKSGVLFKNDSDNEKAPYYKGKIQIEGVEYELAAWVREAKSSGNKFLSLSAQLPFEKRDTSQSDMSNSGAQEPKMGDDVPF
ncbi:hypothetical protein [Sulfurovum sp.]|uniref:hypothetical protein n=1 Tax=Sulfurovum sp. TaxID=1969726 RepID=UPI003569E43F